jgi:hypothetical protein
VKNIYFAPSTECPNFHRHGPNFEFLLADRHVLAGLLNMPSLPRQVSLFSITSGKPTLKISPAIHKCAISVLPVVAFLHRGPFRLLLDWKMWLKR